MLHPNNKSQYCNDIFGKYRVFDLLKLCNMLLYTCNIYIPQVFVHLPASLGKVANFPLAVLTRPKKPYKKKKNNKY